MQRLPSGLWGWGAPTLAAKGNPSAGEMGQLLAREIKSGGDGEYLYAHLLTQREDASSQGSAAKSHSSPKLLFRRRGRQEVLQWDTAPGSPCPPLPRRARPKAAQPCGEGPGQGQKTSHCCRWPAVWSPPWLKGNGPKLTFSRVGLMTQQSRCSELQVEVDGSGIRLLEDGAKREGGCQE